MSTYHIELRTRWGCGKECTRCGLFRTYCPGCITRICLVAKCKRGTTYEGVTSPKSFCRLREYCINLGRIPEGFTDQDVARLRVQMKLELPEFTPTISLTDRRSWFWPDLQIPWIAVRLSELIKGKGTMRELVSRGLHDFLGFEGKVLLSTVMEDELLDKLRPSDYLKMIEEIRPDATMTPDVYTYVDDPFSLSWAQTFKHIAYARAFADLGIPVVGLVKGAIAKQVTYSTEKLCELGCQNFVIPSRELAMLDLLDGHVLTVITTLRKKGTVAPVLLYGLTYPLKRWRKNLVYSGMSWFIDAKGGIYYKGGKRAGYTTDTYIRFEECDCVACKGRMALDLGDDVRSLGLHNLQQTLGRFT